MPVANWHFHVSFVGVFVAAVVVNRLLLLPLREVAAIPLSLSSEENTPSTPKLSSSFYPKYSVLAATNLSALPSGLSTTIGNVTKQPLPLFEQDQPWEPRIDNGYPNIVRTEEGVYECFYGDCINSCDTQVLLFANSSDGLNNWSKPNLGLFDLATVRPDLKTIGTNNNVIFVGGGVGVFRDAHEVNASRRYKAFGQFLININDSDVSLKGGTGVSADGLVWKDTTEVHWPPPQRYDTHTNAFWDSRGSRFVVTTRDRFDENHDDNYKDNNMNHGEMSDGPRTSRDNMVQGGPGRTIGVAESVGDSYIWDTSKAPPCVEQGTSAHQLYSQITFPWLDVYLGIVSVFDTANSSTFGSGKVHCRLSISHDLQSWKWVGSGGLLGRDFIPLGIHSKENNKNEEQWEEEKETITTPNNDNDNGHIDNDRLVPNAFDSHICFAAAFPVREERDGSTRIYYMGGNGPHNGDRNSSLGLATLPSWDHFAGIRGTGDFILAPLLVTGPRLRVTVDLDDEEEASSLQIGVLDGGPLAPQHATVVHSSTVDGEIIFEGGATFHAIIGERVELVVSITNGIIYAVGWGDGILM